MAEVESLCSRIGILNRGELVFLGTVSGTDRAYRQPIPCVRPDQRRVRSSCEADDVGAALLARLEQYKRCRRRGPSGRSR